MDRGNAPQDAMQQSAGSRRLTETEAITTMAGRRTAVHV